MNISKKLTFHCIMRLDAPIFIIILYGRPVDHSVHLAIEAMTQSNAISIFRPDNYDSKLVISSQNKSYWHVWHFFFNFVV